MRPLSDVAAEMDLDLNLLEPYGTDKAKVPLGAFPNPGKNGKVIVITAITPTPAGEGKSTTAVGLTQGLAKIGKNVCLTIRQPSLGPLFGRKGGGTGGGKSVIEPSADINLHFTGDFHAIESAHNFLAAMTDNVVQNHAIEGFDASSITWRRVTDAQDRGLRQVTTGMGRGSDGPLRQTGFDTSAASEIMAIAALASSYDDFRERLSDVVVGWTRERRAVNAGEIGAVGSMMVLLKDVLKPNLVQTAEGQPTIVHMGPFGNIAHGCSSIIADDLATRGADYVVTEAGFGADLGFEKYMDIKVRQGGRQPHVAVVVVTVRGLRWHGGIDMGSLSEPNVDAVGKGSANLAHAIGVVKKFGVPVVVAINRFPDDTPEEIAVINGISRDSGANATVEAKGFSDGGSGMCQLAEAVVEASDKDTEYRLLYEDSETIFEKVDTLALDVYGAGSVTWGPMTRTTARRFESNGWNFPICMAKTHLSVSTDPRLRGAPVGHELHVREVKVSAGARQFIVLAGEIMTLPGLPIKPNALNIDLTPGGEVVGLLGT